MKKTVALVCALALSFSSVCALAAAQISACTVKIHICPTRDEYKEAYAKSLGKASADDLTREQKREANNLYNNEHGVPHYDSETRKMKNLLEFTLSVTEKTPNAKALVCLYEGGKLVEYFKYDTSTSTDFSSMLDMNTTPDDIKVFLWESNFKPICKSKCVLGNATLEYANEQIVSLIQSGIDEIEKVSWKSDNERKIINIIKDCANDAMSRKSEHLLTSEYARRYYSDELETAKTYYNEMEEREKSDFQTKVSNLDSDGTSKLIDYLGVKDWLN